MVKLTSHQVALAFALAELPVPVETAVSTLAVALAELPPPARAALQALRPPEPATSSPTAPSTPYVAHLEAVALRLARTARGSLRAPGRMPARSKPLAATLAACAKDHNLPEDIRRAAESSS